jgi:hypothetical protein
MRGAAIGLAGLLGLGACGVAPDVRVGETEQQLRARLGAPASTARDGDAQILFYQFAQTAILPGTGPTPWDSPYSFWTGPAPPGSESQPPERVTTGVCTLQYRVVGGVVRSWRQSGSGC